MILLLLRFIIPAVDWGVAWPASSTRSQAMLFTPMPLNSLLTDARDVETTGIQKKKVRQSIALQSEALTDTFPSMSSINNSMLFLNCYSIRQNIILMKVKA